MIRRENFSVLCVDDNDSVLSLLKSVFRASGYDVDTVINGFLALQKINKDPQRYHAVITDIQMPGMDGIGLIEASRKAGYTGPIIVYAAMVSTDHQQRLRELHVNRVILKPSTVELLAATREIQAGF